MEPDFSWTTGGQPGITHTRWIDRGGYGTVHEVHRRKVPSNAIDAQYRYRTGLHLPLDFLRKQVFARKVVHPSPSNKDILNEVKVFAKLSESGKGSSYNLVQIYGHGWLPHSNYYLDMELCSFNLDTWIRVTKGPDRTLSTVSAKPTSSLKPIHPSDDSERWELLEESLSIIIQIASGLGQLHNHELIHRDLNPRNGKSLDLKSHWGSAVFTDGAAVEDCRFRHCARRNLSNTADNNVEQRDSQLSGSGTTDRFADIYQ
jgi:hypothetical protein